MVSPEFAEDERDTRMHAVTIGGVGQFEIFTAYAREDQLLQKELVKHLSSLRREGLISVWYDRCINAGGEWEKEIREHLDAAPIVLLLVSASFISSDYCYGVEMKRAMERHESNDALVIPVILRDVDWSKAPFAKLQALPENAMPVTSWSNMDEAFASVVRGLRASIQALISRLEDRPRDPSHLPRMDLLRDTPKLPPLSGQQLPV